MPQGFIFRNFRLRKRFLQSFQRVFEVFFGDQNGNIHFRSGNHADVRFRFGNRLKRFARNAGAAAHRFAENGDFAVPVSNGKFQIRV